MADLQTIYYRIKLDSKTVDKDFLPVEKAIERLHNLIQALGDVPDNHPLLKLYNRQLRDLQEIHRQNRIWYKDVASICEKLSEISTKELQAALKQTQKEWRDLAQAEVVDQQRLEELRRRESVIQDEMAKRDLRRRSFAEDYRKINELTNAQLREGARQSKAALETLHKNTDEMREMLRYATAYADKLAEANGKMSVGKAVDMGSSADKSVHTIAQLNEGMAALQSHVKDFGQYMDDDVLADFNARIGVIQQRVRTVAQTIAQTGNVAPGQRANVEQMEEAQRVLSQWQNTADATIRSSVNTWLANLNHMIKDAKQAIASAADGSAADEARRLLARSKAGLTDTSAESEKARQDTERATQARIAQAKAEAEHQVNIQQIEKDRATAIDEANRKHAESVHLAQLEVEAAEENAAAYKSEFEAVKQRDAYIAEQQSKAEQARVVEQQHRDKAEKFEVERKQHAEAAAEAEAKRAQAADDLARVHISTEEGYHAAIQKRAEAEARLQQTQAEQGKYIKEANAIQSEIIEKTNEQNTLLAKQSGLLHQANLDRRRIKELEAPVKPVVSDGMASAASLAAPDEALRQALGRPSLSKKLTDAIGGVGTTIKEGLGEVGDEVADTFMIKFIGKVKGQMRSEMPRTANDVRSSVGKALDAVVKQMNLSQDQSASLHARLASISTATMTELGEVARSSTSGITYVMRELRKLTEQEMADLQNYEEIAKGADEKAKKRLDALNTRLRELTMTGITRLAQESGLPSEGLEDIRKRLFTPDEKTGVPSFDGLLRGIAGRMGDDKDLRDLFSKNVSKLMADAFGKTDDDKALASEFFGRLRSSFTFILKKEVPSTNDEMRPILKSLMDGIAADMQLTPEQTDKIAKSFEANVKTATLKPLRDRAIDMRRGDDGSFTEAKYLVGQLLTGNGWQDFPGRMDARSLPTGEPAMPARQYRDRIAKMLSGYSRGDGGLAGALGANGGAVQPVINELKLADEKLDKLQRSLREDTPQSLKDVRKAIADMMKLVTVDMQNIIASNHGKLPEAIRDNMIAAIGNALELVDTEIPKIYQDAARNNNGLSNGIREMQSRFSTVANKGTIGKEMSDIINSDHFVDDLKVLFKEKPHQSKQELIKIVQDYLRQEADMLLKAGKVSQESVDKAVDYAQKMIGEKSVSKVYQQLLSPGSYYNADVVAKGTDAIVGSVQRQVKAMSDTLSGTNTLNPFEAMVDSLANKKDTSKLTEGWAKEIKTLKESLSSVPDQEKSGIIQSIEGLTRLSSLTDELKSKIAADGGKTDVYTIIRQHIESLLEAHRKEGEAIQAEGLELNKRIQQEIEENGELFEVTEGEAALFAEKQRRYEASKTIYNEMAKSLSSLTSAQTAQQKAEAEAAEKNRQNAAEAERLKAERRQRIQDAWDARRAAIESGKAVQDLSQKQTEAQQKADSYTGTIKAQNDELDKQTRIINNAHFDDSARDAEENIKRAQDEIKILNQKKAELLSSSASRALPDGMKLSDDEIEFRKLPVEDQLAQIQKLTSETDKFRQTWQQLLAERPDVAAAKERLDEAQNLLSRANNQVQNAEYQLYEAEFAGNQQKVEEWTKKLAAAAENQEQMVARYKKADSEYMETLERRRTKSVVEDRAYEDYKNADKKLSRLNAVSTVSTELIEVNTKIAENEAIIERSNKAIENRRKAEADAAAEATRLKGVISEQSETIKEENRQQAIANQNKNEELRLADQQVEKAKKYRDNIEQTNKAIEQSSQATQEAVAAQQRLAAARQAVADLRTADPTVQLNEEYQQRVAAADKELADAKEAARLATDNERQSLEAYNAALSKNGGVSIAHLKQMRDQIQYLKENVDDNAAIEEYGHLLGQLNKRIAELDAAPMRTVGEAIAEAQSLLAKPLQRVDTSAEETAVANARNVAQQRYNELKDQEVKYGQQIAAIEKEWADDEQNRISFAERRAAAVGNDVEAAKAAVAAADQQAFIDEQSAARAAVEAEKADLDIQREELLTQQRINDEKRKQAGYDDEIEKKTDERLALEKQIIADQQKLSEKPLQDAQQTLDAQREMAAIDDHRLETQRKREQLRQKLNYQAEQEIKALQQQLDKETDAAKQERLNRRIEDIRKNGPKQYNSVSQQNDDYLWREGNAKLQQGRETLVDIQRQRGEIAKKREELEKQHVLANESNNRKMLSQFKTLSAEYGKVIKDNKERLTQMAVDVDHAFVSEAFLGQLRDKYKKIFESVKYNAQDEAGAAFRAQIDSMFRKDMEALRQVAYNVTTGLAKESLNTQGAEELAASARNYMQQNLGIWSIRTDGADIQQQYAKLDESKKQTEESRKQTEESKKQTDEKRKQTDEETKQTEKKYKHVDITADQKSLVDAWLQKEVERQAAVAADKAAEPDYDKIQKASKAAFKVKSSERTEEDKAAIQRYQDVFKTANPIRDAQQEIYKQLGFNPLYVENEYIDAKKRELGLVKEIKQEEQSVTDEKKKQTDAEKSKKQQQEEQRKANKLVRLDKQEHDLDRQERNTLEMMGKREGAQDFYKTIQGLAKLDRLDAADQARLSELQSVIDLAPKASKEWLNYNAAKQQVAEAQAKYDKEQSDANFDELTKAKQQLEKNTEALVMKHGTEHQKAEYDALKKSISELNEKNSEFITEESRISTEMATVDAKISESDAKIKGYTTAIEGAQKAMANLGTARENLAKAEAAAAEWDQQNPYDGRISQEQYDERKKQLADNLAVAKQAHQEALADVAAQQNILRQAAAEGSASLQQLKESYAELQRDFQISNDQSERDVIANNMANLKSLIDQLDVKPMRELNLVVADVAKEGSVQGLQRLRQELQDIAQFSKNADIRNSALAEIANLDKRLEKMNTAPLRDMVAIMGDLSVAKSADQVKRYITELRNLATSGTLTKQQVEQVNSELFKQEQRYKEMTTVTFSYSRAKSVLTAAEQLAAQGSKAEANAVRSMIEQLKVAMNAEKLTLQERSQMVSVMKQLESSERASAGMMMEKAQAEQILADAQKLVNDGLTANNGKVREQIALLEQARNSKNIYLALEKQLAEAQKALQTNLNAEAKKSAKSYIELAEAEKIYGQGIAATSDQLKLAIDSIKYHIENSDLGQQRVAELTDKLKSLQERLKGDGYDQSWLDNVLGGKNENIGKAKLKDLERALRMVQSEMKEVERSSDADTKKFAQLRERARLLDAELKRTSGTIGQLNDNMEHQVDWFTRAVSKVASYLGVFGGFYMVRQQLQQAFQDNIRYSDSLTNIQKTTQLTAESVKALATELKFLDTRTTIDGLNELAYSAGKLGVKGVADVLGFTRAADQINIALGEQLGQGSEAVEQLYKMVNVLGDVDHFGLEQSLLKIGSAINHLTMNSAATAQPMVNFARRLSGVAKQAGMSSADLMGWAAAVNSLGQNVELSATSLSKMMVQLSSNSTKVAQALNMTKEETAQFRYNIDAGNISEALLTMMQKASEAGGLSHLSTIIKDLSGSDGQRVVQTLSTLASNYEQVAHMVRMSNEAFEEGVSVTNEYNLKNQNAAALWEKLQKSFSKILVSPENVEYVRSLLVSLQSLPDTLQKIIVMLKPVAEFIGNYVIKPLADNIHIFISLIEAMATRTLVIGIAQLGKFGASLTNALFSLRTGGVTASKAWQIATAQVERCGMSVTTFQGKVMRLSAYMKTASFGTVWTTLAFIIIECINYANQFSTAAKRWQKENEEAMAGVRAQSRETEVSLNKLLDKYKEAGDNEIKRKDILSQINDAYGDYISNIITEKTSYEELAVAIRSANAELRSKALLASRDAQLQKVEEDNASKLSGYLNGAIKDILGLLPEKDSHGNKISRSPEELQALAGAVEAGILNVTKSREQYEKIVQVNPEQVDEFGRPGVTDMFGNPQGYKRFYTDGAWWTTAEGRQILNSQFGFLGVDFNDFANKDKVQDLLDALLPYINQLAIKSNQREDTMRSYHASINASNSEEIYEDANGNKVTVAKYVEGLVKDQLAVVKQSIIGDKFDFATVTADDKELINRGYKIGQAKPYNGEDQDKYYIAIKEAFGTSREGIKDRNELITQLKTFTETAKRSISILSTQRTDSAAPLNEVDRMYDELKYYYDAAINEIEILERGVLEDKPDYKAEKKRSDDFLAELLKLIEDFYKRQDIRLHELRNMNGEGAIDEHELTERVTQNNEQFLTRALAAALDRFEGDVPVEVWENMLQEMRRQNDLNGTGQKGLQILNEIIRLQDPRVYGEIADKLKTTYLTVTSEKPATVAKPGEASDENSAVEVRDPKTRRDFVLWMRPIIRKVLEESGYVSPDELDAFADQLTGQAFLESRARKGGGLSGLALKYNNFSGMTHGTTSRKDRSHVVLETAYGGNIDAAIFDSVEDWAKEFVDYLNRKWSAFSKGVDAYADQLLNNADHPGQMYATDPKYGEKITNNRAAVAEEWRKSQGGTAEFNTRYVMVDTGEVTDELNEVVIELNKSQAENRKKADENRLKDQTAETKRREAELKAWRAEDSINKYIDQSYENFRTLGMVFRSTEATATETTEQIKESVMLAYRALGDELYKYNINSQNELEAFKQRLAEIPGFAEKVAKLNPEDLSRVYYKVYEYAEGYTDAVTRMITRNQNLWRKQFQRSFGTIRNDLDKMSYEQLKSVNSYLEKFGFSSRVQLRKEVEEQRRLLDVAQKEWKFLQQRADEELRAAMQSGEDEKIHRAQMQVEALMKPTEAVLSATKALDQAMMSLRENTWGFAAAIEKQFEQFGQDFIRLRSWYDKDEDPLVNIFGTVEDRKKAFAAFMDDLKKQLRDALVERVRAAMSAKLEEQMIRKRDEQLLKDTFSEEELKGKSPEEIKKMLDERKKLIDAANDPQTKADANAYSVRGQMQQEFQNNSLQSTQTFYATEEQLAIGHAQKMNDILAGKFDMAGLDAYLKQTEEELKQMDDSLDLASNDELINADAAARLKQRQMQQTYATPDSTFNEVYRQTPNITPDFVKQNRVIVIHHTGDDRASSAVNEFLYNNRASAHAVIDKDGSRTVMATPDQRTWHAGANYAGMGTWWGSGYDDPRKDPAKNGGVDKRNVNDYSIGVEMVGNTFKQALTQAQIDSLVEYLTPIIREFSIPLENIVSHGDVVHTDERGRRYKDDVTHEQLEVIKKVLAERVYTNESGLPLTAKEAEVIWASQSNAYSQWAATSQAATDKLIDDIKQTGESIKEALNKDVPAYTITPNADNAVLSSPTSVPAPVSQSAPAGPRGQGLIFENMRNEEKEANSIWGEEILNGTQDVVDQYQEIIGVMPEARQSVQSQILATEKAGNKKVEQEDKKSGDKQKRQQQAVAGAITGIVTSSAQERGNFIENVERNTAKTIIELSGQVVAAKATQSAEENADTAKGTIFKVLAGIAGGSAKTISELGWWGIPLIAVISGALTSLLNVALNAIPGGGHAAKTTPKTKLVSGMLTYDSGNVQSFPVMGDDGHVYMASTQTLPSSGTGLVTHPTLTTVGGAPALVAERGPEMVIGRETTRQMQMYRPDLFRQILEFDRNRSRGFAKTFDEGNLSDMQSDDSSLLTLNSTLSGGGMSEETGQLLATAIGALYQQLQQPIRAELNTNGKDGAADKMAQAMLNSLRVGDLDSVKRLFAKSR